MTAGLVTGPLERQLQGNLTCFRPPWKYEYSYKMTALTYWETLQVYVLCTSQPKRLPPYFSTSESRPR